MLFQERNLTERDDTGKRYCILFVLNTVGEVIWAWFVGLLERIARCGREEEGKREYEKETL